MMDRLDTTAVSYQVVLTKADKLKDLGRTAIHDKVLKQIVKRPAAHPVVAVTSSVKNIGIGELRAELASLANWDVIRYKPDQRQ